MGRPLTTGHAQRDETAPNQAGRDRDMAHHYRTTNHYRMLGMKTEAPLHADDSPSP